MSIELVVDNVPHNPQVRSRMNPEGVPLLPADAAVRKATPITTGVLDYFPRAIAYVAQVSKAGNDQHNPGEPLHWAREKSTDHADCVARHLIERGTRDDKGIRHTGYMVWRALALLETELRQEEEGTAP
jgi:hypothetical protein